MSETPSIYSLLDTNASEGSEQPVERRLQRSANDLEDCRAFVKELRDLFFDYYDPGQRTLPGMVLNYLETRLAILADQHRQIQGDLEGAVLSELETAKERAHQARDSALALAGRGPHDDEVPRAAERMGELIEAIDQLRALLLQERIGR